MTSTEIVSMDFDTFMKKVNEMPNAHQITADGTELYPVYHHNVVYVKRGEIERTLQLVAPESTIETGKTFPAIVFVQGSAWFEQDVYGRVGTMAELASRGFVAAVLQYRESTLASFPAQIEDTKTGIRFLRKNAEQFHIDPENIFLIGDSSGGHTAVMSAFTADLDTFDTDVYGEYSCHVNAVVDYYGVTDIRQKNDFPSTPNQGTPDTPEGVFLGHKDVYEHPELSIPATCANYVQKNVPIPPILIMHGNADTVVSYNQSIRLYKKLLEEEKDVTFYTVENANHGNSIFYCPKTLDIVESFLRKHMK